METLLVRGRNILRKTVVDGGDEQMVRCEAAVGGCVDLNEESRAPPAKYFYLSYTCFIIC